MKYDVDYFIDKFQRIPEDKWHSGSFGDGYGRNCALGHCRSAYEYSALQNEIPFGPGICVASINDGHDPRYQQPTPKQRILAALRDIKAKQQADKRKEDWQAAKEYLAWAEKQRERIVYVAFDEQVRQLQTELRDN